MRLGLDVLAGSSKLRQRLAGKRLGYVGHPASVDSELRHGLDVLKSFNELNVVCAFGPQHGMRGERQDNMIETEDYQDPRWKIPVYSLYGEVRKPKKEWIDSIDLVLFDLQDVGCRIYTFLTTLIYMMDACQKAKKTLWVLDRPNPVGRPVEGFRLKPELESFVGALPIPMRHGMTLGELAIWSRDHFGWDLELEVVEMVGYRMNEEPGFGWPVEGYGWVNPSPNMPSLGVARAFPGTVLIEGTNLSEGRGTTIPLMVMGAPFLEPEKITGELQRQFPTWVKGCILRPCFFEPTFHKFVGKCCGGLQIHTDRKDYEPAAFRPYRMVSGFLKIVREAFPDFDLWRTTPYEYEATRNAFDLLAGDARLRKWIEDSKSKAGDLDAMLKVEEVEWLAKRRDFLIYG